MCTMSEFLCNNMNKTYPNTDNSYLISYIYKYTIKTIYRKINDKDEEK